MLSLQTVQRSALQSARCVTFIMAIVAGGHSVAAPTDIASDGDCGSCHVEETRRWQNSHHAQAMSRATANDSTDTASLTKAVLGNFADDSLSHFDLRGDFSVIDGHPVMALTRGDATTRHVITDTFGVYPLQQYLANTADGHKQVLPFAWDTRDKSDGGQRWITLHPAEDILPGDRLHWQQPLANWNGMCADCHSTGLVRSYDSATNTFASKSTEVNVGCASCHSDSPHNNNPIAAGSGAGFVTRFPRAESLTAKKQAASPQASKNAANTLGICAACHSLRAPLIDGLDPTQHYLDQFSPTLPAAPLYFADGQIREEVYVWGSFLQSRMHQQGVTCGNCHEPHSQQLLAEGNALCSQCHVAGEFDTPDHHQHAVGSPGAQCVNCHMTSRTYMAVDDRRDHSFRIPEPRLAAESGAPDACTGCHAGRTAQWASDSISAWQQPAAKEKALRPNAPPHISTQISTKELWIRNQAGALLSEQQFSRLQNDPELPQILRASAIATRQQQQPLMPIPGLSRLLGSSEDLITLAAAQHALASSPEQLNTLLRPLLKHKRRAVRVAAAQTLGLNTSETQVAANQIAWRGEGLLNTALQHERAGDLDAALAAYRQSIKIDPAFEPAWINLAELHRRTGDVRAEQLVYSQALQKLPDSAVLQYSYALHLVRGKNTQQAVQHTGHALQREPANAQSAYLHLLLLESLGRHRDAVAWLHAHLQHHRDSAQVLQAGIKLARAINDTDSARVFAAELERGAAAANGQPR